LFLITVHEDRTYIDRDELADFLADHVANDLPKLQHVLGTRPAFYSEIERQMNTTLSSIPHAISRLLADWNGQTGLYRSELSLLCNGSPSLTPGLTEGLRKHGFVLAAGIESIIAQTIILRIKSAFELKYTIFVKEYLLHIPGVTDKTLISSKFSPPWGYKRIHLKES
jgi:hypothetical protein